MKHLTGYAQYKRVDLDRRSKWRGLTLALLFLLFLVGVVLITKQALSAGTVSQTDNEITQYQRIRVLTFNWTADASDGSVPSTESSDPVNGMVFQVIAIPGNSTAPTNNYDIALTDSNGIDIMANEFENLSNSTAEVASPSIAPTSAAEYFVDGNLTLAVTGNSVNSATGIVKVYYSEYR